MTTIFEVLKNNKPKLSEYTLKGYVTNLNTIYSRMYPEDKDKPQDVNKFLSNSIQKFLNYVPENKTKSYQVNLMSAIKAFTGTSELTPEISKLSNERKEAALTQIPSETNIKNHITPEEIDAKYNELYEQTKGYWDELDKSFDMDKYLDLQDYIIFCLVSSKFVPVRRSRDYYDFKIRKIDLQKNNYLDKHDMVFNVYKTSKYYGQQRVHVPKDLYRILRRWIRFNKQEYLFTDKELMPLTAVTFAKRLYKIWGRTGLSTNAMRHAKLQNKYSNASELKQDLKDMGTSTDMLHHYVKKLP